MKYEGHLDYHDDRTFAGWCFAIEPNGKKVPTKVVFKYGKKKFVITASGVRDDLRRIHGIDFGVFHFEAPAWCRHEHPEILFEDLDTPFPFKGPTERPHVAGMAWEDIDAVFTGWATHRQRSFARVDLIANDEVVATQIASLPSTNTDGRNGDTQYSAFTVKLPPRLRGNEPISLKLVSGPETLREELRVFAPVRVLIVSETDHLEDASRRFRCDHLRVLLRQHDIDAHLIGPHEFNTKEWPEYDYMIFARYGVDDVLFNKIQRYRNVYRTKIVYEIDDLVFLPWHTHDLGSVRSGVDKPNDPGLMQMFARRLRLLTLADGAITTTSKIASHLEGLGIKTFLLPNMVRSHEVRLKSRDGDGSVSLLCMSGSPTHYRDFAEIEDALVKVISRHPEVNLTLLGRFQDGLRIRGFDNVRHVNRVPYGQMMRIVDQSDICLVPLELTEFNNAKSCLKYIECGARGVPVIASPTTDYARVIRHGHNGLLAETPFEWIDVLEAVICGEFSSQAIGVTAMRDVEQNFCIESTKIDIKQWLFEEI